METVSQTELLGMSSVMAKLQTLRSQRNKFATSKLDSRGEDANAVVRMINHSPFVSVYGVSGVGKSTFVNDSLLDTLRNKNYVPLILDLPKFRHKQAMDPAITLSKIFSDLLDSTLDSSNNEKLENEEPGGEITLEYKIKPTDKSLWELFQSKDHGYSKWRDYNFANSKPVPVVIVDGFEEIFRNSPILSEFDDEYKQLLEKKWIQAINELSDVAEFRVPVELLKIQRSRKTPLTDYFSSQQYKTIFFFDEETIALIRRLNVAFPTILRTSHRLTGFTQDEAIQILVETARSNESKATKYAEAATILDSIVGPDHHNIRERNLEQLIQSMSNRLVRGKVVSNDPIDNRVNGSDIALARIMMDENNDQGNILFRLIEMKKLLSNQRIVSRRLSGLRFRYRSQKLKMKAAIANSFVFKLVFSSTVNNRFMQGIGLSDKHLYRIARKIPWTKQRTVLDSFRDSRQNSRRIPVEEARIALTRKKFWRLLSESKQYSMTEQQFESMLISNPLFQLSDTSSGRTAGVTHPVVFSSLISQLRKRIRSALWILIPLISVLLLLSIGSYYLIKMSLRQTEKNLYQSEQNVIRSHLDYLDDKWRIETENYRNAMSLRSDKSKADYQEKWNEQRKNELDNYLESAREKPAASEEERGINAEFLDKIDTTEITNYLYIIYNAESSKEAIEAYKLLEQETTDASKIEIMSGCTVCETIRKYTFQTSLTYLVLALQRLDSEFNTQPSSEVVRHSDYLREQLEKICDMKNDRLYISSLPDFLKLPSVLDCRDWLY